MAELNQVVHLLLDLDIISAFALVSTYLQHTKPRTVKQSLTVDVPSVFSPDINILIPILIFRLGSSVFLFYTLALRLVRPEPRQRRCCAELPPPLAIRYSRL